MRRCYIVPPYLLRAVSNSGANPTPVREAAINALVAHDRVIASRRNRLSILATPRGARGEAAAQLNSHRSIVPDILLSQIAENPAVDEETRERARRDLEHIQQVHARYQASQQGSSEPQVSISATSHKKTSDPEQVWRGIYDAKHSQEEGLLPGSPVRLEGQNAVKDIAVNDSYDNFGHVWDFYWKNFQWNSIDNKGMHIIASCHYGNDYENACEFVFLSKTWPGRD
jgi:Protealysin propeptide/Thermolysin metallopeptidase, catalytic domain